MHRLSRVVGLLLLGAAGCSHSSQASFQAEAVSPAQSAGDTAQASTKEVTYTSGATELVGFMAYPATTDPRPAVLVVHEWWGLNDYARMRAEKLAELGYVAMAIDMYGAGKTTTHPEEAKAFMGEAMSNTGEAEARFRAALDVVKADPGVQAEKIAAIGYCFGGATVLHMVRAGEDLDVVASFHGMLAGQSELSPGAFSGKIFVATGGADPFVPAEQVAAFRAEMDKAGADYELVEYPGAKHAFTNPHATAAGEASGLPLAYDAAADEASWARLVELLEGL